MNFRKYIENNDIKLSSIDMLPNNNMLTEAGLARVIQKVKQEDNDFAIITAYRDKYSKKENIQRNRKLRSEFNSRKMGVYQLVGHWQECELEDVDYDDCPKDKLVDVVERSYLVIKPKEMQQNDFKELIRKLTSTFNQDASLISLDGNIYLIEPTDKMSKIGDNVTLGKINQAYSQHVKKMNVPFVFEAEVPSSNSGRRMFNVNNILYPKSCSEYDLRSFE
ncbi:MAG: hypothetical protein ACOCP8_01670 [archaeon]